MAEPEHGSSPLAEALARVGDRWTLLVVEALLPGPLRFNDLLSQIPGIAANILSDRLKRLERDGLLVARPYSQRPPRADYQLTAEGTDLAGALRLLAHWGAGTPTRTTPRATPPAAPRSRSTGTALPATSSSTTTPITLRRTSCNRRPGPAACRLGVVKEHVKAHGRQVALRDPGRGTRALRAGRHWQRLPPARLRPGRRQAAALAPDRRIRGAVLGGRPATG